MSSPAPFHSDMDVPGAPSPFGDIASRPMRVKVLYTFDSDNQTNCLARLPDVLKVPVLPIDDVTQIGVIELRQCIRAIVAASPELVARLTQGDFTIYAFDYSEYETPLVGQGMLSTILAANSPTPTAPAHQSRTMITGRVCKNIMGLFSSGVSETLEVKLRLVPVPRPVQSEYVKNMEMYRNMSPAMSGGFDPNAWSENNGDSVVANLEQQSQDFVVPDANLHSRQRHMSNASMGGRPNMSSRMSVQASRPSSRTSVRSEHLSRHRPDQIINSMESFGEDGPAKKRAKITQTDWRGKSTFGGNQDSLRVTASTAASIRVHKPVATRPGLLSGNSLEPPPRAPTPVPRSQDPSRSRQRAQQAAFIRRGSSMMHAETPQSDFDIHSDAVMSSPEDMNDQDHSPLEFPSSPPAMPEPSSPGAFPMPRPLDSGYMSGGGDYMQDDEEQMGAAKAKARANSQKRRDVFIALTPGPPELLPTRMIISDQLAKQQLERSNSLALPPRPNLEHSQTSLSESAASFNNMPNDIHGLLDQSMQFRMPSQAPTRDATYSPAPSDDFAFGGKPRSGSGAKRKKVIHDKLMKSLADGNMPTYCYNCGAIETPTWRSLYVKNFDGEPTEQDRQDVEGECRGVEIVEQDEVTQKVTKFRIIKSARKAKDKERTLADNYSGIQVCNPCGLWFNKFRFMRPEKKWSRGPKDKVAHKRGGKKDELRSDMLEPASDFPHSDFPQSGFWTDQILPDEAPVEDVQDKTSSTEEMPEPSAPATRPSSRPRASSLQPAKPASANKDQWSNAELSTALARAIQSSPARFLGTQESPIELGDDLTPKPTRRLLFPSPRKDGEVKSLDDSCIPPAQEAGIFHAAMETEKENLPPLNDDDLVHLFGCSPFKTPSKRTPPSAKHYDAALLSTPTPAQRTPRQQMDAFLPSFSSAEKEAFATPSRFLHTSPGLGLGREPLTPFSRHLSQLLSEPVGGSDFAAFGDLDMSPGVVGRLFEHGRE